MNISNMWAFASLSDFLGTDGDYSFVGILLAAFILVVVFVCLVAFWYIPKFKKKAKGFNVGKQLSKLDKNKFKVIRKMYFENFRNRKFAENIIIGNNGVFVVKAQFELGKISKNEKGKFVVEKDGAIHVLGDYEQDNKKVFDKMVKLYNRFSVVKFYSVVAFPNSCEINYTPEEGFFGKLKDVADYIESQTGYKMNDEMRDDLYNALCKEDEKNRR